MHPLRLCVTFLLRKQELPSSLAAAGVATVAPKIPNVSTQVAAIPAQLAVVVAQFASISFDFAAVGTKLWPGSSFAPILAILAHVRSQLATVLPYLSLVATNFSYVRSYLSPIRTQFPALPRCKVATVRLLGQSDGRRTKDQRGSDKPTSKKCNSHFSLLHELSVRLGHLTPSEPSGPATEDMEERQTSPLQARVRSRWYHLISLGLTPRSLLDAGATLVDEIF